jgi:hypothetical protein
MTAESHRVVFTAVLPEAVCVRRHHLAVVSSIVTACALAFVE